MHKSTTPSLSQTIWPRWVSRQFLTLPIVQTLLHLIFGYSLSSEAVVMRQLRRWKRCDEGLWHAHTRGLPWGLPELFGMVEKVHCIWRRLLRRGLEFHVCTIKKVPIRKKSGNLFNDPRIYTYTHTDTHVHTHKHTYTRIHTYTYTHTHTYIVMYIIIQR